MILKGQKFSHPRFVKEIPPPPTIIRPHPHGIDVERIRRMIVESQFEIPTIDDAMIEKVQKRFRIVGTKNLSFTSIMEKAKKKWKTSSTSSSCSYIFDVISKNGF